MKHSKFNGSYNLRRLDRQGLRICRLHAAKMYLKSGLWGVKSNIRFRRGGNEEGGGLRTEGGGVNIIARFIYNKLGCLRFFSASFSSLQLVTNEKSWRQTQTETRFWWAVVNVAFEVVVLVIIVFERQRLDRRHRRHRRPRRHRRHRRHRHRLYLRRLASTSTIAAFLSRALLPFTFTFLYI